MTQRLDSITGKLYLTLSDNTVLTVNIDSYVNGDLPWLETKRIGFTSKIKSNNPGLSDWTISIHMEAPHAAR